MAGYNLLVVLPDAPTAYRDIADGLAWPGVDVLMRSVVVPHAAVFTVALAAAEAAVGVLMMTSGRKARVALWCAAAFMLGMFLIVSYYALANVPLVVLALVLLRPGEGLGGQGRVPRWPRAVPGPHRSPDPVPSRSDGSDVGRRAELSDPPK